MENLYYLQSPEDDKLMMDHLAERQPLALDKLYSRYKHVLKSVVMKVVRDEADAEDVIQDVLIQVWDRPRKYSSDKGKLVCWLSTLARRRALDRIRRHSAYQRATDRYEVACNHSDKEIGDSQPVERAAHRGDQRKIIEKHIQALPPAQQEAIRLNFFEGKTQREIAELTGAPLGTVKTRIELGIKKLSTAIESLKEEMI